MGKVVSIFDNKKYIDNNNYKVLLTQNIINDINKDIESIICGLNDLSNIIRECDGDNSLHVLNIRESIKDLKEYQKENTNIDFVKCNTDDLLFRLHIIENISQKTLMKKFTESFNKLEVNEIDINYIIGLVDLYIDCMRSTLLTKFLDYDNYENNILGITSYIEDECKDLYFDSKREVYNLCLHELVSKNFDENSLSFHEKQFLDSLIEDSINMFINYDYVDIRNYFLDVLSNFTTNNIFKGNFIDLDEENQESIKRKIDSCKTYYSTLESIRKNKDIFMNDCVSLENRYKIENDLLEIEKVTNADDNELNNFINENMVMLYDKVMSLINSDENDKGIPSLIIKYLSDDLEIKRVIKFISIFKYKVFNYKDNKSFDFNKNWLQMKSRTILDKLYTIIREKIFDGEDKEFYSNRKYRHKLEDVMLYISSVPDYLDTNINNEKLIPDFNMAIVLLKKGMELEEKAKKLGLDNIVTDINDIDYRDYNYTSSYIFHLDNIIDSLDIMEKYSCMKEELSEIKNKKR